MRSAMAFGEFPGCEQGIGLLQRSLQRGRLGHAYLFTGHDLAGLEALARTLAEQIDGRFELDSDNGCKVWVRFRL